MEPHGPDVRLHQPGQRRSAHQPALVESAGTNEVGRRATGLGAASSRLSCRRLIGRRKIAFPITSIFRPCSKLDIGPSFRYWIVGVSVFAAHSGQFTRRRAHCG